MARRMSEEVDKVDPKKFWDNPNTMYHYYVGCANAFKEAWERITGKEFDVKVWREVEKRYSTESQSI